MTRVSYTVNEAIAVSGIKRTTLFGLMKNGSLPRIKIGSVTLVRHADLIALMDENIAKGVAS